MVDVASPSRHQRRPERSTPSRLRWSRLAAWLGLSLLALASLAVVLIWTAPRWASSRIEAELEQRIAARLDATVEVGELELDWKQAELRDVSVVREGVDLQVDRIHVVLDRGALWSARFEVVEVEAIGGYLEGDRQGVEELARKLQGFGDAGEEEHEHGWLRRRLRLTPGALELRRLAFAIDDGDRRATGTLAATAEPGHERVELRITSLLAELGLGRPLRAASLRTTLEREGGALRFPLTVEVAGVAADVDRNIAVAGVHGSVTASDAKLSELSVELAGGFAGLDGEGSNTGSDEELWSVSGRFARDLSAGTIALDMQAFELGRVPEVLAQLPLVESERATIGGHLELDFAAGIAEVDGQLTLAGLNVSHELLAREVVRDVGFGVDIDATLDPAARRLAIERLSIERAGVELLMTGELVHTPQRETRRYQVALAIPDVACQAVLDAIPRELIPGLLGFELDGKFSAELALDADFAKLDELKLEGKIGIDGCRVRKAPRLASAERLGRGFVHRVTMRDGRTRRSSLYPGSSSYTPLANISRYMSEAVLTTEDGSFRKHDGFNYTQLQVALRRNLQSGKVRLGASTITMQMVKNVLLSHERTLSRKLQELFLTWHVEQSLSKQRIMELYLNVIEFGPGVYGVTNAARHYFGKHPSELSSLEAAYLALMLPSPVRRHVHYCNGALSQRFEEKLHYIHNLMLERGRITAAEHAAYAARPIEFDLLERGDPQACLDEIEALLAGSQTQRALSGLLGDEEELDAPIRWADPVDAGNSGNWSWGVRPPLPEWAPLDPAERSSSEPGELRRLEPRDDDAWVGPSEPIDPANSDAPGRPAMDEDLDIG
ncbi:MAG: biosynthetic peptidoglycan transglycosylase [Enhygromyxa sp.]